ncbi:MAG: hypothetical protein U1E70_23525 [Acetobacteraceae bacterium]|nr:hypothetical protein [Pseudomonadota bacterium]
MLEEQGFATVALASVRPQAEKTRPPRALWSAAPLGRPLGVPGDAAYQTRMIQAALALLERTDGPVILEDFPHDPPAGDNPAWVPPALMSAPGFAAELKALMPWWEQARQRFGRTTVGLSGVPPEDWPAMTGSFLNGGLPTLPLLDTPALALRFLCDDIKALYGEAAQALGPAPSPTQIDTWFWRRTEAGTLLQELRKAAMASENNGLKTVGGRFLVPAPWVT